MTDLPTECQKTRRMMRRYVLGTLRSAAAAGIETHIETCSGCREALEAERKTLAALDVLDPVEPTTDLTAAVMDEVRAGKEKERTWRPIQPVLAPLYGTVAIVAIVGILAAILLPVLARSREAARRASSANNLKQFGVVFKMYSNEYDGFFPPLAPYDGIWMVDLRAIYPEYLTDLNILVAPSLPERNEVAEQMRRALEQSPIDWEQIHRLAARSYTYFGWSLQDDSDVIALKERYPQLAKADYHNDIFIPGGRLYRVRNRVERFFIANINRPASSAQAQSEIPVMFDAAHVHVPKGSNVLYMDGHVKFIRYPGEFPVTPTVLDTFRPSED